MGQRWWITLATGLTLTVAYLGYSRLMAPAVKIPRRTLAPESRGSVQKSQRPVENVRVAQTWLSESDWAEKSKYLLRTDQMFLFTNEWTPNGENGLIRFRPFAAVWISHDSQGREQAVTVSAESALLKFESAFEIDKPQLGRVTGGSLDGEVHVTGPDGLEVDGENFLFTEATNSLYSTTPVRFRMGENRGKAGRLHVQLIKSKKPIAKDRPNIVGVEAIQLKQGVEMQMKLGKDESEQPMKIKCSNMFEYRVETRTAIYHDDVWAYRTDANAHDVLRCDRLTVQFEPKVAAADGEAAEKAATADESAGKSEAEYQRVERNLEFRSLKAESLKGGQRVVIRSDERKLRAWMSLLTYDAATRVLEMTSPAAVRVKQGKNELECPHIRLVLGEGNTLEEAVCEGAGWLETYDEQTNEIAFAADWIRRLRKSTDPETQLDLIELEEEAKFQQTRESGLMADRIRLWFTPAASNSASNGELFQIGGGAGNPDPQRLLAESNVALISPQIEAEAREDLEVIFEGPASAPAKPDSLGATQRKSDAPVRDDERPALVRGAGSLKTLKPTALASVPPEAPKSETPLNPAAPIIVAADKIRVRMERPKNADSPPEVRELWTTGHVEVKQPAPSGGDAVTVTGERLQVELNGENEQVVHVYGEPGRPAHVRGEAQQLHIEGQVIHLDRGENLAWVEGAGLLQMEVSKTFDGEALDKPQILDVWWKERMDFDGLLATFDGDVRAKLAEASMECQSMQVALSRKVSFQEQEPGQANPEMQTITCRNGVKFENQRYVEAQLMDIQHAKMFEFHLDNAKQQVEAKGPGWMQMWRRGKGKMAGLAVTESVQANRTSKETPTEWDYTRVDFAGRMAGQIAKRRTAFHDRVEVLYGPVMRPMDVFQRNNLPKEGGWMKCDKLEVAQSAPNAEGKAAVQLLGMGNTNLEGRGFWGRADQISYDETKGLFVLRSLGNRKATIWQQKTSSGSPGEVHSQRIDFIPVIGWFKVNQAVNAEGSQ